jgi:glycosyltransferase involved in cell wall biosynthesis
MKIAFLTPEYPHVKTGSAGGIGTSIKNLAMGLISLNCEILILVYGQNEEVVFDDNGLKIMTLKNIKFKGLSWYLTRKKIQYKIDHLYKNKEIDLVEAADWTGITSFISPKKCPIILKLNGSDTYFCDLENRKSKWINRFHEKRALQKANFHVSVSVFTAKETNRIFNQNFEYQILPNAINAKNFENSTAFISENENKKILYFGSLIRKKGMLELPFIFNKLVDLNPNVELILVGKDVRDIATGSKSTWQLMQPLFTAKAFLNVKYLGSLPYSDIRNVIQNADVCIFPSFIEAFPVSWLEAMAMSKPIVASNIGWASEIISDGVDGFLINPKNHEEFSKNINILLNNKQLKVTFGNNAKQKIENYFDSDIIAKKNLDFYEICIGKNKK